MPALKGTHGGCAVAGARGVPGSGRGILSVAGAGEETEPKPETLTLRRHNLFVRCRKVRGLMATLGKWRSTCRSAVTRGTANSSASATYSQS